MRISRSFPVLLIAVAALAAGAHERARSLWPIWGKDRRNSHFARGERAISAANASLLAVKWIFDLGQFNDCAAVDCSVSATPTVDEDRLPPNRGTEDALPPRLAILGASRPASP